ncbi:MAG TPA: hypothetical protein VHH36_09370, partial [Candidatus Thermoplasmatota archaeon]|nr:hypothetical protein [Candidatus Thermoplasmatota archaeon]
MRLALLALVLLSPPALALGEVVDLVAVEVPPRTAAERVFSVSVDLANRGDARRVYLLAALYADEGTGTCGSAADPRFRTFTPLVQAVVDLPARAQTRYPPEGQAWQHRYRVEDAADQGPQEFCVFAAEDAPSGTL